MFKILEHISRGSAPKFSTRKFVNSPSLILRSTSLSIFENLALEDWLYQNHNFEESKILLFYKNSPCVVIGRHQNPWTEANLPFLRENSIDIGQSQLNPLNSLIFLPPARRNSGGGTVYHDTGNINISFITRKEDYDRGNNLELVCSAVRKVMDVDISVNKVRIS